MKTIRYHLIKVKQSGDIPSETLNYFMNNNQDLLVSHKLLHTLIKDANECGRKDLQTYHVDHFQLIISLRIFPNSLITIFNH